MVSDIDLAYAAGLFDGEGTFIITKGTCKGQSNRPRPFYFYPAACIEIRDELIVNWMKEKFGGIIAKKSKRKENHSDTYIWRIRDYENLRLFINKIHPYLKIKSKQVDILNRFIDLRIGKFTKKLTDDEWDKMVELHCIMKELNKTGVNRHDSESSIN